VSITFLNAAALMGLALVALPIAIHLLVRTHTRVLAYPSLRFVRETALAAFRRRAIEDAALLACRVGIVAAAAAALAAPVLRTDARASGDAGRVSRALVALEPGVTMPAGIDRDAFRVTRIERAAIGDALIEAVRWLNRQPPSAREIVLAGPFRRGSVTDTDLLLVAEDIGIRFVEVPAEAAPSRLTTQMLVRRNGRLVRADHLVTWEAGATRVAEGAMVPVAADHVRVIAAPGDQPLADAALVAALETGVPDFTAPVTLVWEGADRGSGIGDRGSGNGDQRVTIPMDVPEPRDTAAKAVWRALVDAGPGPPVEPEIISEAQRNAWSRPPGPPHPDAPPADEGDRRWLWALVLALLVMEHYLRRSRPTDAGAATAPAEERVA
jgi:hypothetical protein